ncbi:hypothetical protein CIG11343_0596 [Campylobacter iguaniorum]|nr:hypothetical protein [Campylobacter iguaniorum]ANE35657.1 hypothetical protein CIG11343_0596 [Campylobacter iguaniorum]
MTSAIQAINTELQIYQKDLAKFEELLKNAKNYNDTFFIKNKFLKLNVL